MRRRHLVGVNIFTYPHTMCKYIYVSRRLYPGATNLDNCEKQAGAFFFLQCLKLA